MTEKRLPIDIAGLREAFRSDKLANIAWIRSESNLTDALTKDQAKGALNDAQYFEHIASIRTIRKGGSGLLMIIEKRF